MSIQHDFECLGNVRIVTDGLLVFQGQIRKNDIRRTKYIQPKVDVNVASGNEFILLELDCDVAIIRENGNIDPTNPPLFEEGDLVRINLDEIIAIGPSDGCFVEEKDAKDVKGA